MVRCALPTRPHRAGGTPRDQAPAGDRQSHLHRSASSVRSPPAATPRPRTPTRSRSTARSTRAWSATMLEDFTEETGIELEFRDANDSELANQIVQEGDASPADVFLTENSPSIDVVDQAGLLAPLDEATLAAGGGAVPPGVGHLGRASPPGPPCSSTTPTAVDRGRAARLDPRPGRPRVGGPRRDRRRRCGLPGHRQRRPRARGRGGHPRVAHRSREQRRDLRQQHRDDEGRRRGRDPTSASCTTTTGTATRPRTASSATTRSCTTSATRTRAPSSASPAPACSPPPTSPRRPSAWSSS